MSLAQLDSIIGKVDQTIETLERNLPDHVRRAGLNAKELIDSRITNTGLNAEGQSITNQFTGNVYSVDYAEFKKSKGRQVAYVDLQLTGDMWRNVGVEETVSGNEFKVTVQPRNEENQKKMDDNARRYGPILALSDEESAEIGDIFLQSIINDFEIL